MIRSKALLFIILAISMFHFLGSKEILSPYGYTYTQEDEVHMDIVLINIPTDRVTDYVLYIEVGFCWEEDIPLYSCKLRNVIDRNTIEIKETQKTVKFDKLVNSQKFINVFIKLKNKSSTCVIKNVANGTLVSTTWRAQKSCLNSGRCKITVDVDNKCDYDRVSTTETTSVPHRNQFIGNIELPTDVTLVNQYLSNVITTSSKLTFEEYVRLKVNTNTIKSNETPNNIKFDTLGGQGTINVYKEVKNKSSMCVIKTVSTGTLASTKLRGFINPCLNSQLCPITVDLENKFDSEQTSTTETTSVPHRNQVNHNLSNVTTSSKPVQNNMLYIGIAVVFIVVVLCVIITVKKCLSKNTTPISPQAKSEPFYLNLLFRKECQREMEEADSAYAEII